MSIFQSVVLPSQPVAGSLEYIPLGGDGLTAPQSAWFMDMQITGDATGGAIRAVVLRDDRFEHILQFMSVETDSATAVSYRMDIFRGAKASSAQAFHNVGTTQLSSVTGHVLACQLWTPPAVIGPVQFEAKVPNVDTELFKFKLLIYNFQVDASKRVPLNILFQCLIRAASSI